MAEIIEVDVVLARNLQAAILRANQLRSIAETRFVGFAIRPKVLEAFLLADDKVVEIGFERDFHSATMLTEWTNTAYDCASNALQCALTMFFKNSSGHFFRKANKMKVDADLQARLRIIHEKIDSIFAMSLLPQIDIDAASMLYQEVDLALAELRDVQQQREDDRARARDNAKRARRASFFAGVSQQGAIA